VTFRGGLRTQGGSAGYYFGKPLFPTRTKTADLLIGLWRARKNQMVFSFTSAPGVVSGDIQFGGVLVGPF
jgi:hypothetical protein